MQTFARGGKPRTSVCHADGYFGVARAGTRAEMLAGSSGTYPPWCEHVAFAPCGVGFRLCGPPYYSTRPNAHGRFESRGFSAPFPGTAAGSSLRTDPRLTWARRRAPAAARAILA
jgi:hypothetical protein